VLNDPKGEITTPNYGEHNYAPGLNIRWSIIVSPGHRIKLTFKVSPSVIAQ
jgi:hypothetical protein